MLYPFGFGLSYTSFEFSNLRISNLSPSNNEIIEVSFDLTDVGNVGGYEVTQLYIRDLESSHVQPFKRLKKFYKCFIDVGEIKKITFELNAKDFKYWNPDLENWYLQPGQFEIQIGSSSADIHLSQTIAW